MSTVSMLESKITELNNGLVEFEASNESIKSEIGSKLAIIEDALKALQDENVLADYDFEQAYKLLIEHELVISSLEKSIKDIKVAIEVKKELQMDMPLSERQLKALNAFEKNLNKIRNKLNLKIEELEVSMDKSKKIKDLESLKDILSSKEKDRFFTEEMINSLYEAYDLINASPLTMQGLLEGLYDTRNLRINGSKSVVSLDEVKNLYGKYFDENYMKVFGKLLEAHEEEVTSAIDMDGTKDILNFFSREGLLNKFRRTALLKVSLYGSAEYIKEVYERMLEKNPEAMEIYFEDNMASVWITDKKNYRRKPFRVTRGKNEEKQDGQLYYRSHNLTFEEFWENIELINQNADIFSDKYDPTNIGAHLKAKTMDPEVLKTSGLLVNLAKTTSNEIFKKNIGLARLFGLGEIYKMPVSAFDNGNLENKLHLVTELGLLNPPMSQEFLDMENHIVGSNKFSSKNPNTNIRNYYSRYLSKLSSLTMNEIAYMFRKLDYMGREGFYSDFFSDSVPGRANQDFFTPTEKTIMANKEKMDELVSECFTMDWYPLYIDKYDDYAMDLQEFTSANDKFGFEEKYYDEEILSDPLIKELEEKNTVMDLINDGNRTKEVKNEYVYLFDGTIISRYKVLHNASILKCLYGYLDEEMLLTSIVNNSYLNEETFKNIEASIKEEKGVTL